MLSVLQRGRAAIRARVRGPVQAFPAAPPPIQPATPEGPSGSRRWLYMTLGSVATLAVIALAVVEGPKYLRTGATGRPQMPPATPSVAADPVPTPVPVPAPNQPITPAPEEAKPAQTPDAPVPERRIEVPPAASAPT